MRLPVDAFRDFCLWPYEAPVPVLDSALGSDALLLALLDSAGADLEWRRLVAMIRSELGAWATVWGFKSAGGNETLELYFYDYARIERSVSVSRVLNALRGLVPCGIEVDDTTPYFMFSIELPIRGMASHRINDIDIYIGNPGSAVSSGICYRVTADGAELKSFYFFFDRASEWDDIVDKACCSAHTPLRSIEIEDILPAWLTECRRVVVANKRSADGFYCSGIRASQLVQFAAYARFREETRLCLASIAPRLDHLLFDVGYDITFRDGVAVVTKSSFYGLF